MLNVVLAIAIVMGIVGCIGLGSAMSANVLERTREFGVMHAIGARASDVRRIVVLEGVFVALVSCVVAVLPALLLTAALARASALATLAPPCRASRFPVRQALAYL